MINLGKIHFTRSKSTALDGVKFNLSVDRSNGGLTVSVKAEDMLHPDRIVSKDFTLK